MDKRSLLSGCMTPICGAKMADFLKCDSYESGVCSTVCPKMEKDAEQMDLWPEWNPSDAELDEMAEREYAEYCRNYMKDLNGNAERV